MSKLKKEENLIGDAGVITQEDKLGNMVTAYSMVMFFLLAFLGFMAILYH